MKPDQFIRHIPEDEFCVKRRMLPDQYFRRNTDDINSIPLREVYQQTDSNSCNQDQ